MGEHGDRVDDVERIGFVPERRLEPIRRDVCEGERIVAPPHEFGIEIGTSYAGGFEPVPVAKDAAAAATEVEQRGGSFDLDAPREQPLANEPRVIGPALEVRGEVEMAGDRVYRAREAATATRSASPSRRSPVPGA